MTIVKKGHTSIINFCELLLYLNITDPACQNINTKQRCYVLDRSCPSQRFDARDEKEMKEEGSSNLITYAAIGVSLFIVLIFAAAIFIRKFYLKKGI